VPQIVRMAAIIHSFVCFINNIYNPYSAAKIQRNNKKSAKSTKMLTQPRPAAS